MAEITNTPTYDYSTIGSIGSDAVQSVSGEMINKIRAAEEKSIINPITENIDNLELEAEKILEIKSKISEFQDIVSYFDISSDENVFNQYYFDTSGTAAVYNAVDMSSLEEGTTSINITQLAQKDVFQSDIITGNPAVDKPTGTLMIEIDGEVLFGEDTNADDLLDSPLDVSSYTYEELANEINQKEGLSASIEQVGDSNYRLIVKSTETGTSNALTISGTNDVDFNRDDQQSSIIVPSDEPGNGETITINGTEVFTFDNGDLSSYSEMVAHINDTANGISATIDENNQIVFSMDDGSDATAATTITGLSFTTINGNHTQQAQNLNATIDGVNYNTASNSITTQGSLKVTAVETGISTVNISYDTSAVTVAAEAMATKYNELTTMINDELYDPESVIEDKESLKTMLSNIKNMLFADYGADKPYDYGAITTDKNDDDYYTHANIKNNDINIFVLGFELDKKGTLTVDTDIFNKIVNGEDDNYDFNDLKNVFTGTFENKGLGVQLEEYLDTLDGYNGLISNYETSMLTRQEELEEEKEKELEKLDVKYGTMAEQFSAYSALIAQLEASFSGLKMMIAQSQASN